MLQINTKRLASLEPAAEVAVPAGAPIKTPEQNPGAFSDHLSNYFNPSFFFTNGRISSPGGDTSAWSFEMI